MSIILKEGGKGETGNLENKDKAQIGSREKSSMCNR